MSQSEDHVPQRIGDAERDHAAECLRDHLSAGRLDQREFDERLQAALTARTAAEFRPLFADLPEPRPDTPPASTSGPHRPPVAAEEASGSGRTALTVLSALLWPAAIIACFITGWQHWWLLLIPIFFTMASRTVGAQQAQRRHQERRLEREQRLLEQRNQE